MTGRYPPYASRCRSAIALRAYLGELAVMASIVTTLLWVPLAAVLAGFFFLFDSSLLALVTFGGALNALPGLAAWWFIGFVPALGYAAYVMPWDGRAS